MKNVKHPKWDKQEYPQLYDDKFPVNHIETGMVAVAAINGVEITVRLVNIPEHSKAEAEVLRIDNKDETIEGLSIGDTVFIELHDMKRRRLVEKNID